MIGGELNRDITCIVCMADTQLKWTGLERIRWFLVSLVWRLYNDSAVEHHFRGGARSAGSICRLSPSDRRGHGSIRYANACIYSITSSRCCGPIMYTCTPTHESNRRCKYDSGKWPAMRSLHGMEGGGRRSGVKEWMKGQER